jgi:hypothetical protein
MPVMDVGVMRVGYVSVTRLGADGDEVRQEDRLESARAGARRGSGDVRVPTAHGGAGVRIAR